MSARDELKKVIAGYFGPTLKINAYKTPEQQDDELTDAILAAGYTKPRTITTAKELDELPGEVLVLTEQGGYWESVKRMDGLNWWKEPGSPNVVRSEDLTLPATVLYEPPA